MKNAPVESSLKKNKSDYFGSATALCKTVLKSCKDEINNNTDQRPMLTLKKQADGNHHAKGKAPFGKRNKSFKRFGNTFKKDRKR